MEYTENHDRIVKETLAKVEKDKKYFERQIKGLILILNDAHKIHDQTIHRNYVIEKLNMILTCGIGFHPSIISRLERLREESGEKK